MHHEKRALLCAVVGVALAACVGAADRVRAKGAYVAAGSLPSPHATQAAAADERVVYAVSNTAVVLYDRATGKELAQSTGQAEHLNSAFLWQGRLYCAHSNYPRKPHQSDLRVLDPATWELTVFHTNGASLSEAGGKSGAGGSEECSPGAPRE